MNYDEAMAGNTYHRFDSQFFKKEYLIRKQKLKLISEPLHMLMQEGSYGILPKSEDYVAAGLPLIRGGDLRRPRLVMNDLVRVPESYFSPKYRVEKGDLLILVKGATIDSEDGVLLIDEDFGDVIFNGSVFRIKLNGRLNPYYVMAFMRTSFFTFQKTLAVANNGIEYNSLDSIRNYLIPGFSSTFQESIEQLVKASSKQIEDSQALYRQAETDLLDHLILPAQAPHAELHEVVTNVKTLDHSSVSSGRWDAEFYETRHDSLAAQLKARPWLSLGSACRLPINRGVQPEFVEGGDVFVVASKAVRAHGLDLRPDETTSTEFFASPKAAKGRIQQYDVLLNGTGRGTLGRAGIHTSATPALADNHVTILRLYPGRLNPFYLMLFLNSWPGQLQSEQWQCGSSGQTELYPNQMEQFIIPDLPPAQQAAIADQVQRSFALRIESEALLTRAKQAVEVAIEQGETVALAMLQT